MAKYKVEIPFRLSGKTYGAGDEITLNQAAGDRHANLGYVKEIKATSKGAAKKAATKGAAKSAAAKAKESDTATLDTTTDSDAGE